MNTYPSLNEMLQDVRDFGFNRPEGAPAEIRDRMRTLTTDLVGIGEFLQAVYDADRGAGTDTTVGPVLMQIVAGGLLVFAQSGFLELGKDVPRATGMRMALLRDAGEPPPAGAPWPEPSADPAKAPVPAQAA